MWNQAILKEHLTQYQYIEKKIVTHYIQLMLLNVVIKNSNNGLLDKTFMVDWSNYENTLLLTNGDDLRRINLVLMKRIDI